MGKEQIGVYIEKIGNVKDGNVIMTVNIVIGTSWSGKKEFIKKQFPDSWILSVGEYQRRLREESDNELYVIIKANDMIMEEQKLQIRKVLR